MDILPAIDLKDGKAVRLSKGLMESAKIYSDEPWQVAKRFEELGSKWLHIVDLNGAFAGEPANLEQIKKIRENCNLKIELGGGIRDEKTIKMYLELGVDRLILGSIAVKNPTFVKEMAAKYPIAVGIDAMNGMVAVEGWAEVSTMKATDLASLRPRLLKSGPHARSTAAELHKNLLLSRGVKVEEKRALWSDFKGV